MATVTYVKHPNARLDYAVDWSAWLPSGDTIASVVWVVPADLTLTSQSNTNTVATAWLEGGVAGETYFVGCQITTTLGRVDERALSIRVAVQ